MPQRVQTPGHWPLGGGGRVIATGTPEQVAAVRGSYTGQFLVELLPKRRARSKGNV